MQPKIQADRRDWLTVEEAARELSIGRNACYTLVRRGVIRSAKLGASIRIHRSALDELAQGEPESPAPLRRIG